ncbi:YihY/virulence factor BrkB family protein [Rhodococcus chondri]|uniref:YhjD/YihY/BrkB family envelope integrity protein n=1 Tax=Rhodococcus chondri TaxID=3065941 RepID=A0ABU7JQU3_9NOCA|nr:YhjD/YihY/BrkB family envelope integrity protein [Rhodococcus sp. CC-R104]MEE2032404.1 YhjD/YihY/BrkB family envelope integrity protein [Rhodococcus sp. CC-R104]
MDDTPRPPAHRPRPRLRRAWRRCGQVLGHTAEKAWDDSIFSKAATAAFWQTLSLPPLLLGLLGSLGYVGGWFGPDTVDIIISKTVTFTRTAFSESVVDQIIQPTVEDVLSRGRADVMSLGFVLSLWAGSSAIATFIDSIVEAHGQQDHRHPVWQRLFGLLLYVIFLILAVFTLPLVALGPTLIGRLLPESWYDLGSRILDPFYYPAVGLLLLVGLTTLYKVALPKSLPWHRLLGGALLAGAFFLAASVGLRWYLKAVTETGYTYGALAAPIAFLLFTFFLGFAVVLGAEFNATIQEFWPARATRMEQLREWLAAQSEKEPSPEERTITNLTRRLSAAPIRLSDLIRVGERQPDACPIDAKAPLDTESGAAESSDAHGRTGDDGDIAPTHAASAEETSASPADELPTRPSPTRGGDLRTPRGR